MCLVLDVASLKRHTIFRVSVTGLLTPETTAQRNVFDKLGSVNVLETVTTAPCVRDYLDLKCDDPNLDRFKIR